MDPYVLTAKSRWDRQMIREAAMARYGETDGTFLDTTVWDLCINIVIAELMRKTGGKVTSALHNVVAGTSEYTASADAYQIVNVKYDGDPLDLATYEGLDEELGTDWESDTGTPSRYLLAGLSAAAGYEGTPTIRLYPTPESSLTNGLRIRYRETSGLLGADTDVPAIMQDFIPVVVSGVCELVAKRDSDGDRSGKLAAMFHAEYAEGAAEYMRAVGIADGPRRILNRGW